MTLQSGHSSVALNFYSNSKKSKSESALKIPAVLKEAMVKEKMTFDARSKVGIR